MPDRETVSDRCSVSVSVSVDLESWLKYILRRGFRKKKSMCSPGEALQLGIVTVYANIRMS